MSRGFITLSLPSFRPHLVTSSVLRCGQSPRYAIQRGDFLKCTVRLSVHHKGLYNTGHPSGASTGRTIRSHTSLPKPDKVNVRVLSSELWALTEQYQSPRKTLTPSGEELHESPYTIPNALTVARILACPFLGYNIVHGNLEWATAILVFGGVSDGVRAAVSVDAAPLTSPSWMVGLLANGTCNQCWVRF
jgi:hypothetical protein